MATSKEKLQIIVDAQGIAKTKAQLKAMEKQTGAAGKSFIGMAAGIAGATVALLAIGKGLSFAIRVGKEFEQSMANVKAISGATGSEFKALEANARKLGASTKFTASEVAGLQTSFAKLGFTSSEINKVTKGTLALAAATGSDLATSASVAGNTLRGFGLDVKNTGKVTDVMAKSFSSSALDMQKFSDSMKYVAPVAKLAGFEIEGTTAMLGQLANAGIDGSMAGTALRKIFLELSDESSTLSERLGGPIESVDELIPALERLNEEGVTTAEMKDMVGQRAISAFSILLEGAGDIDVLTESFRNSGGAAQAMADIQLDTLEGKLTIMNSAMEGLGIAISDYLLEPFKSIIDVVTLVIGSITEFIELPMADKLAAERVQMDGLFQALESGNIPLDQRKKLMGEINTKYGDYLPKLLSEKSSLEDIKKAREAANTAFMQSIILSAQEDKIAEVTRRNSDLFSEYGAAIAKTGVAQAAHNTAIEDSMKSLDDYNEAMGTNLTAEEAADEMLRRKGESNKWAREHLNRHGEVMKGNTAKLTELETALYMSQIAVGTTATEMDDANMIQQKYAMEMAEVTKELTEQRAAYKLLAESIGVASDEIEKTPLPDENGTNIINEMAEAYEKLKKKIEEFAKGFGSLNEEQMASLRVAEEYASAFTEAMGPISEAYDQDKEIRLENLAEIQEAENTAFKEKLEAEDQFEKDRLKLSANNIKEKHKLLDQEIKDRQRKEIDDVKSRWHTSLELRNIKQNHKRELELHNEKLDDEATKHKKTQLDVRESHEKKQREALLAHEEAQAAKQLALEEEIKEEQRAFRLAETYMTTAQGAISAFTSLATIPVVGVPLGLAAAAAALAYGARRAKEIKAAQFGMDEVVTKPTLILAGEAGPESVNITPLDEAGEDVGGGGGSQTFNIHIEGNVMTDAFVEEELSVKISDAIRRGVDFGIPN